MNDSVVPFQDSIFGVVMQLSMPAALTLALVDLVQKSANFLHTSWVSKSYSCSLTYFSPASVCNAAAKTECMNLFFSLNSSIFSVVMGV